MKTRFTATIIGMAAAAAVAGAAQAKTLVYCSEGAPEGFNASLYTAGTTFDATSRPSFDQLVMFKPGTTEIMPGPGLFNANYLRGDFSIHRVDFF